METPKNLREAVIWFAEFENCRKFMMALRWPDGLVKCPRCGAEKVTYLEKQRVWKCYAKHERPTFSLKTGTIFEDSPIALEKWLCAAWLLISCKNGISSYEVHRALGVTQKSAWFMLHRIRLAMKSQSLLKFSSDGGPVEVDESYVGGEPKNRHKKKAEKRTVQPDYWYASERTVYPNKGRGTEKTAVFGMLDRDSRQVRAQVVPNVKREVLISAILDNVEKGGTVYSDSFKSYQSLAAQEFVHETVNHLKEYVRGDVHTNGIENFWSLLKRGIKGTYIAVEPFHLDRYVDEQVFRFNNRATKDNPLTDADRFALVMSQIVGRRLTYDELTGKTERASL